MQQFNCSAFSFLEKCSTLENGVFYEEKIILKSSILAVAAGLSVFAINSVFADELPVQFMGVNDFHGALEQTGTARLEGETVKMQEQPHFWQPI